MADAEDSTVNSRLITHKPADFFYLPCLKQWQVSLNLPRWRHGKESYPKALWLDARVTKRRVFAVRRTFVSCLEGGIPALIEHTRGKAR